MSGINSAIKSTDTHSISAGSRTHEGPFCNLPDILLKEILRKLPPSDPAALNLLKSQVSLFARSVYGAGNISRIVHFPAQKGEKPTSAQDFRRSILAIQNPNLAYKAQIAGAFIGQVEAIFETDLKVNPSEFHDVLGQDLIKARYLSIAESQFQMGYAQHLCLALDLKQFLKSETTPNLHALFNLDRSKLDRAELKRHFDNQKRTVDKIRECERAGGTELDLSNQWNDLKKIHALPPHIGALVKLTELNLRYNQLTALPSEIGKLGQLKNLNLWCNELTTLPAEVGKLEKLRELDLRWNPLTMDEALRRLLRIRS